MTTPIVTVQAINADGVVVASGSGFIVGLAFSRAVLTSKHFRYLATQGTTVRIMDDSNAIYQACAIREHSTNDVALLWFDDLLDNAPYYAINKINFSFVGQQVQALVPSGAVSGTVTSFKNIAGIGNSALIATLSVESGSSGSALIRQDTGDVVGIVSAYDMADNCYAVSSQTIAPWLRNCFSNVPIEKMNVACLGKSYNPEQGTFA